MALKTDSGERQPVILIAGVAEGLGASIAAQFARDHIVVGLARTARAAGEVDRLVGQHGGTYTQLRCDLTSSEELTATLAPWAARIDVAVYNAGAFHMGALEQTSAADFERLWRTSCLGAFLLAQALLPHMAARGHGTLIFSGATASLRGGGAFAAFASAKFALRGLAQSLAREYGPKGVHVAHTVLDGVIDSAKTRSGSGAATAMRLDPDAIAAAYRQLVLQSPTAWTQELDLRTCSERF